MPSSKQVVSGDPRQRHVLCAGVLLGTHGSKGALLEAQSCRVESLQ
jgi:hypothetical protein